MEQKTKEKKNKSSLLDKIVISLCSTTLLFAGCLNVRNIVLSNTKYLKPLSRIESDAGIFDANLDIAKLYSESFKVHDIIRLKHNNNEPIYATIDKNIKDEKLIDNIKTSLNYIENIFSDINDKYRFEIIDENSAFLKKTIGKTVIKFETFEYNDSLKGLSNININKSLLDKIIRNDKVNVYNINSVIKINSNFINEKTLNSNEVLVALIHEILHCFGLGDVYYSNNQLTFMNVDYGFFSKILAPNDLRILYSAYCDKHIKANGEVDIDKVKEINTKLDLYEKEYFNTISKMIIDKYEIKDIVQMDKLNGVFSISYQGKNYLFNLNNNKAQLIITDKNGVMLNQYNGDIQYGENFAILKDFYDETNKKDISLYFNLFKNESGALSVVKIANLFKTTAKLQSQETNIEPER